MRTVDALRTLEAATSGQGGLITSAQAARVGIDRTTLSRLAAGGDLAVARRGVYALPSAEGANAHQEARSAWLASAPTLFADERAGSVETPVLSHASAAQIHGIGTLVPRRHTLTTAMRKQSRHSDIHYVMRQLKNDDVVTADGMTVTSAARTVGDLAATHTDGGHLAEAVRDVLSQSLTSTDAIAAELDPYARNYGQPDGGSLLSECFRLSGPPASTADVLQALPPDILATVLKHNRHIAAIPGQIIAQRQTATAVVAESVTVAPETLSALRQAAKMPSPFTSAQREGLSALADALTGHVETTLQKKAP